MKFYAFLNGVLLLLASSNTIASLGHTDSTTQSGPHDIRLGANMDLLSHYASVSPADEFTLGVREVELSLEAGISENIRAALFLSRPGEEAFGIEEAAVIAALPGNWRLKAGQYRNEFGLLNTIHEPERPQATLPLPLIEFLGEEQLREPSITLGKRLDLSDSRRAGISAALLNSDNDIALDGGVSGDKAWSAKLYYGQSGKRLAWQTGLSLLSGKNDDPAPNQGSTQLSALDFRILLDPRYASRFDYPARLSLSGEYLDNTRKADNGASISSNGYWLLLDWQMKPGRHLGIGYEYSEDRLNSNLNATALSMHYSWYYTRHGRIQLELRQFDDAVLDAPDGPLGDGFEALLQWNVVLGAHSERPFLAILPFEENI